MPARQGRPRRAKTAKRPTRGDSQARRLQEAFAAVERLPALASTRARVVSEARREAPDPQALSELIESDPGLTIAVLRFANRRRAIGKLRVGSVPRAVELMTPARVAALAGAMPAFDFFQRDPSWAISPEQYRIHAVATQRAADRIAEVVGVSDRDELLVAALLHDLGRLVLMRMYPDYPTDLEALSVTPEARALGERRQLGIDHCLVGGVLARRWALPLEMTGAIERHHAEDAEGMAAVVSLADMLAHYGRGGAVKPDRLSTMGRRSGVGPKQLRELLSEFPYPRGTRPRATSPCPLSTREMDVLRKLAEGKVYKQIAHEMGLSPSTVRTHLHNVYGKLSAVDRAQAVLIAKEKGWL